MRRPGTVTYSHSRKTAVLRKGREKAVMRLLGWGEALDLARRLTGVASIRTVK